MSSTSVLFLIMVLLPFSNGSPQVYEGVQQVDSAISGIIGPATGVLSFVESVYVPTGRFGCEWLGSSPTCYADCDNDQDGYSFKNHTEDAYGGLCVLGNKRYCCRPNGFDVTWKGTWHSGATAKHYHCRYHKHHTDTIDMSKVSHNCGFLDCSEAMARGVVVEEMAMIDTYLCNSIHMFGRNGTAYPGIIVWTVGDEEVDWWYKANVD